MQTSIKCAERYSLQIRFKSKVKMNVATTQLCATYLLVSCKNSLGKIWPGGSKRK
jgi:hypothetical protein